MNIFWTFFHHCINFDKGKRKEHFPGKGNPTKTKHLPRYSSVFLHHWHGHMTFPIRTNWALAARSRYGSRIKIRGSRVPPRLVDEGSVLLVIIAILRWPLFTESGIGNRKGQLSLQVNSATKYFYTNYIYFLVISWMIFRLFNEFSICNWTNILSLLIYTFLDLKMLPFLWNYKKSLKWRYIKNCWLIKFYNFNLFWRTEEHRYLF